MRTSYLTVCAVAILAAGCDPEAPVQSSDVDQQIDSAVAVHAADSTTHSNLLLAAANISGEFGSSQIGDDAIGNSQLANDAVGSNEIADGSIALADMGQGSVGATQIVDASITGAKLQFATVGAAQMAPGAVTGGLNGVIADETITQNDITTGGVGSTEIADMSIATGDLGDMAVSTAKINDMAVTTGKINDMAVTTGKINDMAVTTAKVNDMAVTTAKLNTAAVDDTKLAANAVTTTKIANDAVTDAAATSKLNTATSGRSANNAAFVDFYAFKAVAMSPASVTITFACGAEGATAGTIRAEENGTAIGGQSATCPANSAADPAILQFSFTITNGNSYTLAAQAGAAASAVMWRHVSVR